MNADRLHDDIYLNGRFTHSAVVSRLAGRRDSYGRWRQADAHAMDSMAETFANTLGASDAHVARGISLGLYLSEPNYGAVGYQFMKDTPSAPLPEPLGLALIRVVLHGIDRPRVEKIFKSVKSLLEGNPPTGEEEKAALAAYRIRLAANAKEKNAGMYAVSQMIKVMDEIKKTGTIETFDFPASHEVTPTDESEERARALLDVNVAYYDKHFDEIDGEYLQAWQDYPREAILICYVVSLDEYTLKKNEQRYKETPTP